MRENRCPRLEGNTRPRAADTSPQPPPPPGGGGESGNRVRAGGSSRPRRPPRVRASPQHPQSRRVGTRLRTPRAPDEARPSPPPLHERDALRRSLRTPSSPLPPAAAASSSLRSAVGAPGGPGRLRARRGWLCPRSGAPAGRVAPQLAPAAALLGPGAAEGARAASPPPPLVCQGPGLYFERSAIFTSSSPSQGARPQTRGSRRPGPPTFKRAERPTRARRDRPPRGGRGCFCGPAAAAGRSSPGPGLFPSSRATRKDNEEPEVPRSQTSNLRRGPRSARRTLGAGQDAGVPPRPPCPQTQSAVAGPGARDDAAQTRRACGCPSVAARRWGRALRSARRRKRGKRASALNHSPRVRRSVGGRDRSPQDASARAERVAPHEGSARRAVAPGGHRGVHRPRKPHDARPDVRQDPSRSCLLGAGSSGHAEPPALQPGPASPPATAARGFTAEHRPPRSSGPAGVRGARWPPDRPPHPLPPPGRRARPGPGGPPRARPLGPGVPLPPRPAPRGPRSPRLQTSLRPRQLFTVARPGSGRPAAGPRAPRGHYDTEPGASRGKRTHTKTGSYKGRRKKGGGQRGKRALERNDTAAEPVPRNPGRQSASRATQGACQQPPEPFLPPAARGGRPGQGRPRRVTAAQPGAGGKRPGREAPPAPCGPRRRRGGHQPAGSRSPPRPAAPRRPGLPQGAVRRPPPAPPPAAGGRRPLPAPSSSGGGGASETQTRVCSKSRAQRHSTAASHNTPGPPRPRAPLRPPPPPPAPPPGPLPSPRPFRGASALPVATRASRACAGRGSTLRPHVTLRQRRRREVPPAELRGEPAAPRLWLAAGTFARRLSFPQPRGAAVLGASGARTPSLRLGCRDLWEPGGPAALRSPRRGLGGWPLGLLAFRRLRFPRCPCCGRRGDAERESGQPAPGQRRGAGRATGRSRVQRPAGPKRVVRPAVAGVRDGARGRVVAGALARGSGGPGVRLRHLAPGRRAGCRQKPRDAEGGGIDRCPRLHLPACSVATRVSLHTRWQGRWREREQAWQPGALRPVQGKGGNGEVPGCVGDQKVSPGHEEPGGRVAPAGTMDTSRRRGS
ncbi:basic proline-rich protein-like [Neovison vison]|uniref:basic proline-rich protein-like n=1 Tax=Neovison vison TaxID=452646 RepID=UPI001CF04501|nr:basic proline-rich protein-like [Neogale vison]